MSAPQDAERNESQAEFSKDEFDEIPYDARYYGTHRKALPQVRQRNNLKWVQLAGALALLIGAFSFLILPTLLNKDNGTETTAGETTTSQSQSASETESTPTATSESPTSQSPTDSPEGSPSGAEATAAETTEPGEAESTPAAEVDYQQVIEVYNTTAAPGSAAEAGQTLRGQGFTVPVTANWQGFQVTASTVYYATEEQRGTADAVANALGITNVEQREVPAIVVVLAGN